MSAQTQSLADLIIDVLGNKRGRFFGLFKKRPNTQTQQLILSASQAYVNKFRERHGQLKILGMRKPVSLDSVYVPVRLLEESEINRSMSIDDMEKACRTRHEGKLPSRSADQRTAIDIANETQYLSIIGAPGAGKTTLLRKIGLEALKDAPETQFQHGCMPIWIDLKKLEEDRVEFQDYIEHELEFFDFPESATITENALKKGRFLILFDGLDEVSSRSRSQVLDQIETFVERYEKNRYVISCRAAAYRSPSNSFREITLGGNSQEQIKNFIYNWFSSEDEDSSEAAESCWNSLRKSDNSAVRELAQTPLLLTFLCLVYSRSLSFSGNRSILYHQGLRILLTKWFEEKRVSKEGIYEGLHIELEEKLLAEIAYKAFREDKLLFTKVNLVNHIRGFLLKELNAPKNLSGEAILDAIAIQQGILVEQSPGIYSFSHLTFQEFLAAKYIHENYTNQALSEMVRLYANDKRWEEIFLLVAGLKYDATNAINLLLYLNQVAQGFINTEKLSSLWLWAAQVTGDESSVGKLVERRANALYRAFHYSRILAKSSKLKGELETVQAFLQYFIYNLRASSDLTLTTYLINALHTVTIQLQGTGKLSDAGARKRIQRDLKKAIILAKPLANKIRKRASVRSMRYLKSHEQPSLLDEDLRRNEIFANSDFLTLFEQLNRLSLNLPGTQFPNHVHKKFFDELKHVCLGILRIDESWLTLTQEEARSCQDCLYITQLLLKCRREAKRVTPELWASVEKQILSLSAGGYRPALVVAQSFLDQVGAISKQEDEGNLLVTEIPEKFGLKSPFFVSVVSGQLTKDSIHQLFNRSEEIRAHHTDLAGLILYEDLPENATRELIADLKAHQDFNVIPISLAEVEQILPNADECKEVLSSHVRRYTDTVDFFKDKTTVRDKLLFFGRTELLTELATDVKNNQSVGLFGLRKSGKSSVLHQLSLVCQDRAVSYTDLQKYNDLGYGAELLDEILHNLYRLAKNKNSLLEQPPILAEGGYPLPEAVQAFYGHFKKLSKDLEGVGYALPILCCLDNLDQVFPRSNEKFEEKAKEFSVVFGALRALNQKEQLMSLVITAVQPQCNRIKQWDFSETANNPLHGFFEESFLKPFSIYHTAAMINGLGSLMKWEFDRQTVQAIHRLSGGHPFLVRKIAGFLAHKASSQPEIRDKGRISFVFAQENLRKVFRDQSLKAYVEYGMIGELRTYNSKPKVHHLLNALSVMTMASNHTDGWLRARTLLAFLSKKLSVSEIQCLDAVHVLQNLGIVEQMVHPEGYDCYRIRVLLLHQWFQMLRKAKSA
ncbi:NACHT domain-containing protein [Leptothoe sp. PORK10 BA2]|uniref:NACHT domain-containing protein n=1 Tax=Leptothoe sp. PORK10 BA2 TaxID=3110254 RepID=UPI002B21BDE9|nr:NACHT domain-containing protein [Leptothoe sp. PORK10 BA2]MEA5464937.1 NACHT domain-containing protein [Leptothoe sp. PORK10 BA2]